MERNQVVVREEEGVLLIELKPAPVALWKNAALLIGMFAILVLAIYLIFFVGLGFGLLFYALVFSLILYYSFKSFLWNTKGKEVIKVTKEKVSQVIHYGALKDEASVTNSNIQLAIELENTVENKSLEKEKILDHEIGKYEQDGIVRFVRNKEVILAINTRIPAHYLELVEQQINAYIK